jgi:hypothetical protein
MRREAWERARHAINPVQQISIRFRHGNLPTYGNCVRRSPGGASMSTICAQYLDAMMYVVSCPRQIMPDRGAATENVRLARDIRSASRRAVADILESGAFWLLRSQPQTRMKNAFSLRVFEAGLPLWAALAVSIWQGPRSGHATEPAVSTAPVNGARASR